MATPHQHPVIEALTAVLQDALTTHDLPVEEIEVEHLEATPNGYLVRLTGGTRYFAGRDGTVERHDNVVPRPGGARPTPGIDDEIRLTYRVTGGIVGRPREYRTTSEELGTEETRTLRRLITEAKFFDVDPGSASTFPDGQTRRLQISVGRRQREVLRGDGVAVDDTPEFEALLAWAEDRLPQDIPGAVVVDD